MKLGSVLRTAAGFLFDFEQYGIDIGGKGVKGLFGKAPKLILGSLIARGMSKVLLGDQGGGEGEGGGSEGEVFVPPSKVPDPVIRKELRELKSKEKKAESKIREDERDLKKEFEREENPIGTNIDKQIDLLEEIQETNEELKFVKREVKQEGPNDHLNEKIDTLSSKIDNLSSRYESESTSPSKVRARKNKANVVRQSKVKGSSGSAIGGIQITQIDYNDEKLNKGLSVISKKIEKNELAQQQRLLELQSEVERQGEYMQSAAQSSMQSGRKGLLNVGLVGSLLTGLLTQWAGQKVSSLLFERTKFGRSIMGGFEKTLRGGYQYMPKPLRKLLGGWKGAGSLAKGLGSGGVLAKKGVEKALKKRRAAILGKSSAILKVGARSKAATTAVKVGKNTVTSKALASAGKGILGKVVNKSLKRALMRLSIKIAGKAASRVALNAIPVAGTVAFVGLLAKDIWDLGTGLRDFTRFHARLKEVPKDKWDSILQKNLTADMVNKNNWNEDDLEVIRNLPTLAYTLGFRELASIAMHLGMDTLNELTGDEIDLLSENSIKDQEGIKLEGDNRSWLTKMGDWFTRQFTGKSELNQIKEYNAKHGLGSFKSQPFKTSGIVAVDGVGDYAGSDGQYKDVFGELNTGDSLVSDSNPIVDVVEEGPGYLVADLADGTRIKRVGNQNWRKNNPGNATADKYSKKYGSMKGDAGGPQYARFTTFPTLNHGLQAMRDKLFINPDRYKGMSIEEAISTWAPPIENKTEEYIRRVTGKTGMGRKLKLSSMNEGQREAFIKAVMAEEGYMSHKNKEYIIKRGTGKTANLIQNPTGAQVNNSTPLNNIMMSPQTFMKNTMKAVPQLKTSFSFANNTPSKTQNNTTKMLASNSSSPSVVNIVNNNNRTMESTNVSSKNGGIGGSSSNYINMA